MAEKFDVCLIFESKYAVECRCNVLYCNVLYSNLTIEKAKISWKDSVSLGKNTYIVQGTEGLV